MKEYEVKKERDGIGFKIMYPTPEDMINELKKQRIKNPQTMEQAKFNQKITIKIKEIINDNSF